MVQSKWLAERLGRTAVLSGSDGGGGEDEDDRCGGYINCGWHERYSFSISSISSELSGVFPDGVLLRQHLSSLRNYPL